MREYLQGPASNVWELKSGYERIFAIFARPKREYLQYLQGPASNVEASLHFWGATGAQQISIDLLPILTQKWNWEEKYAKEKKYFDISSEKVACLWMGNEVAM